MEDKSLKGVYCVIYRVSQEEWTKFGRVFLIFLYRYNPKDLYPKLNGYGDNGHRKVMVFWGVHTLYAVRDAIRAHCACPENRPPI